jgi:hypothetical protein
MKQELTKMGEVFAFQANFSRLRFTSLRQRRRAPGSPEFRTNDPISRAPPTKSVSNFSGTLAFREPEIREPEIWETAMRPPFVPLALAAAGLLAATTAVAADHEAGVPLTPAEAVGSWAVASKGQDLCTLTLGAAHTVKAPATCGDALSAQPTAWQPTRDGMQLMGANGQPVLAFHRWSNSLFVSHRSSGVDIQLRRRG